MHPDKTLNQRNTLRAKNPSGELFIDIFTGKATISKTSENQVPWYADHSYKHFKKDSFIQIITGGIPPKGKVCGHARIPSLTYILIKQHKNGFIQAGLILSDADLRKFKLKAKSIIYLG